MADRPGGRSGSGPTAGTLDHPGRLLAGVTVFLVFAAAAASQTVRGEALAGLFLIAYFGMIVPAVGMGVATEYVAATIAMAWFTGVLVTLLAAIGGLLVTSRLRERRTAPLAR